MFAACACLSTAALSYKPALLRCGASAWKFWGRNHARNVQVCPTAAQIDSLDKDMAAIAAAVERGLGVLR